MPGSAREKERLQEGGFVRSFRRYWQKSYLPDWLGILFLALQNLAILFFEPFNRLFSLDNRDIQYPHAEVERVPVPMLFTYAVGIPTVVIILHSFSLRSSERSHQLHVALLGLTTSIMLTTFLTDLIKNGVGRPRPDLIARCKPEPGTPVHQLVSINVCTETDHHTLHDGFRSFPSGHSSTAWSGLGYLALYLAGQLKAFTREGNMCGVLAVGLPAIGALWITISRTEDYRHHAFDVSVGSVIGILITYFCYRRYFRSIVSLKCNEPYPRKDDDQEFERLPTTEMEMH